MSDPVVLVTGPDFDSVPATFLNAPGLRCVRVEADEPTLSAAVSREGASHVIVGGVTYRGDLYRALPRGAVLARFGVGFDGIDLGQATAAGVLCTNTPDVLNQSVAELTILLMLGAARWLPALDANVRAGRWDGPFGGELHGKTLAIIGHGRIGRAVERIAAGGFQMRVLGCGRGDDAFAGAVAEADYVSLHMPATAANRQFINAERLAMLPPRAWLINTARGAVVDERALYDALASGRLRGASLDVFDREPYVPVDDAHDLRRLPNVVLTPHVGSFTVEARTAMAERAMHNVRLGHQRAFEGMDLLNREVLTQVFRP